MALSLTAEQKAIIKIFKIEEQYVIPAYQRPYSWGYDQCFQLYNDLMDAFKSNEDYFIGNIIIAKSESNKEILEVIDGQQRLTTLLLLIKVLHIFHPELKVLADILEQEDWEGNEKIPRIRTNIFEAEDGNDLDTVLQYDKEKLVQRFEESKDKKGNFSENKAKNKFEINTLYFYDWLNYFVSKDNDIKKFVEYLLKKVYLLPIELTGKTQEEANEKALIIFETINNRGMNLEDADIFKAKLYKKAKKVKENEIFIEYWIDFKKSCENLNLEIDDVFRYYSHIIRGKENITSSEISLREFFIRKDYSPFGLKKYKEVLDDLFKIIEILEFINTEKRKENEISKWFQLIEAYTNQYPKFAVVTYLFVNGLSLDSKLILFLKSLIRYVYYQGSTTRVKFEIYNIIKKVSSFNDIDPYYEDVNPNYFNYLGRLKYGFALLAFYLIYDKSLSEYNIDKIISLKDKSNLKDDWNNVKLDLIIDDLGNFVVLDIRKRNISILKKKEHYNESKLSYVKAIFNPDFTFDNFKERDRYLKRKLVKFFKED